MDAERPKSLLKLLVELGSHLALSIRKSVILVALLSVEEGVLESYCHTHVVDSLLACLTHLLHHLVLLDD